MQHGLYTSSATGSWNQCEWFWEFTETLDPVLALSSMNKAYERDVSSCFRIHWKKLVS